MGQPSIWIDKKETVNFPIPPSVISSFFMGNETTTRSLTLGQGAIAHLSRATLDMPGPTRV